MKPAPFKYHAPRTLDETLSLLASEGEDAKLLAGGQSLIPVMNFRLAQPSVLIDINRVAGLEGLRVDAEGNLRLGPLVRHATLERHPLVQAHAPLLADAAHWIAHPQIRYRGTLGGSLAHADPAAELPAVMVALEARFRLASQSGERWVEASSFFDGLFATLLDPQEVLVEILIPPIKPRTGSVFLEVARRKGDYALVGVAATLTLDPGGRISDSKLVFLSVGDGPVVAQSNELQGRPPSPGLFSSLVATIQREIEPSDDIHASADYRRHLAGVLTQRALDQILETLGAATHG